MGTVVIDAGVLIGLRDSADAHHGPVVQVLRSIRERGDNIVLPASAYSEALVQPARLGQEEAQRWTESLRRVPVDVLPIDEAVAEEAARLRATHRSLRLPDALVIASASVHAAAELVTTDRGWPTRRALKFSGKLTVL